GSGGLAQAVAEGLTLAEFYGGTYKTGEPAPAPPPTWTVAAADGNDVATIAAVSRGRTLGECSNLARELANEPGNTLTPREFARRAIALLKAPMRVIGVVPTTENMPGGRAVKPGDILKSAAGKTVEVINTDAEGRLILGDGLWYARQLGATHLVDVATLTGAVVVALGKLTSGLFGTPAAWVETVRRVAEREGDRVWPMPVFDDYFEQIKSEIA